MNKTFQTIFAKQNIVGTSIVFQIKDWKYYEKKFLKTAA